MMLPYFDVVPSPSVGVVNQNGARAKGTRGKTLEGRVDLCAQIGQAQPGPSNGVQGWLDWFGRADLEGIARCNGQRP
jgi:hypothetical protein